jgi:hypothetical protein
MQQFTKLHLWFVAGLPVVMGLSLPALAQKPSTQISPAQNRPARTYQPGYWQPIARIDPKQPITVVLINQTNSPLKYNFLDGRSDSDLPVEGNVELKDFSLPVNIAIYNPTPEAAAGKGGGLRYETSVKNNVVEVRVKPVKSGGYRVLNISRAGGIYLY